MWLEVQGMAGDEAESLSVSRIVGQPGLGIALRFFQGRVGTCKGL